MDDAKLAAMRQLAYGASHEINNPLANISTRAQLLLAAESDENKRRHLASIYSQAMRAHEMICDMMLFAHPPAPTLKKIEVSGWLRGCVAEFSARFSDSGWQICGREFEDSDSSFILGDRVMLTSMLYALVQNATESALQGKVNIHCKSFGENHVDIEVHDSGPGISNEVRRHMFDPFYSGREAGRGLGFGLSKAWTMAQIHGGRMWVSRTGAEGTAITIRLPAATDATMND